jgi:hypothetical protein
MLGMKNPRPFTHLVDDRSQGRCRSGFGQIADIKKVSVQAWRSEERVEHEARHAVAVSMGSEPIFPDGIHGLQEAVST